MKSAPYLFLFSLALILVFILGVRYGQRVEKTNKAIDYVLKLTPTRSPVTPTPTPIQYATSEGRIWRIKFIYPSFLKLREDASHSAVIFEP